MTSQIITDLQEEARTFLEEKQSLRYWKEIRRENIKSLQEKKNQGYDQSIPRQEQGCLGGEYHSVGKKTPDNSPWRNVKTLLMDEVEGWERLWTGGKLGWTLGGGNWNFGKKHRNSLDSEFIHKRK